MYEFPLYLKLQQKTISLHKKQKKLLYNKFRLGKKKWIFKTAIYFKNLCYVDFFHTYRFLKFTKFAYNKYLCYMKPHSTQLQYHHQIKKNILKNRKNVLVENKKGF